MDCYRSVYQSVISHSAGLGEIR